jgi:hypothetical protein
MATPELSFERPYVSIQGTDGSYHDKGAKDFFGDDYRPIMCDIGLSQNSKTQTPYMAVSTA